MENLPVAERTIDPLLKDSFNLEYLQAHEFESAQRFRYDCHQVLFLHKAEGQIWVDGQLLRLQPASILLISKGQVYSFGRNSITGHLLQFGDCFWQKAPASAADCKTLLFEQVGGPRLLQATVENFERIRAIVHAALKEFKMADYSNKGDALAAYLKIIIIQIANVQSLLPQETATFDGRLYQRFLTLVQQESRNIRHVSDYADRLGVPTRKLTDCCRQFGTGAKEVIHGQLIAEAKRLLQFSARSVKEVAGELNFANPYQFSHYFKKYTRLSPSEYQQRFVEIGI